MPPSSPPYAIWSIWEYLSISQKLLFLALCVLGLYSIFCAVVTVTRLRNLTHVLAKKEDIVSIQRVYSVLRKRCARLQQFIGAAFYLFGFVLFTSLQWAYITIGDSRTPGAWLVLENLGVCFAFAANVFFLFLFLHLVQWFISGRLDAFSAQQKTYLARDPDITH